jgi:MoaD family protein
MAKVRLFAQARETAGCGSDVLPGTTVADVLQAARARYGADFGAVLDESRVWVNGEPTDLDTPVDDNDEVAILPPVSGG